MEVEKNYFELWALAVTIYKILYIVLGALTGCNNNDCKSGKELIGSNPFNSGNEFQWTILIWVRSASFIVSHEVVSLTSRLKCPELASIPRPLIVHQKTLRPIETFISPCSTLSRRKILFLRDLLSISPNKRQCQLGQLKSHSYNHLYKIRFQNIALK